MAGFRDSVKDADCGCVISIVFQGPGDECPGVQEQPPTRSLLPAWILTIFVPERPGDPTESRGESEGEVDAIGEIVSEAATLLP